MDATPTITIRHSHDLWHVYDLQGAVSEFRWRDVAIAAAYRMLANRKGLIQILDAHGRVLESIDLRSHDPNDR